LILGVFLCTLKLHNRSQFISGRFGLGNLSFKYALGIDMNERTKILLKKLTENDESN